MRSHFYLQYFSSFPRPDLTKRIEREKIVPRKSQEEIMNPTDRQSRWDFMGSKTNDELATLAQAWAKDPLLYPHVGEITMTLRVWRNVPEEEVAHLEAETTQTTADFLQQLAEGEGGFALRAKATFYRIWANNLALTESDSQPAISGESER